jgi:flagellar biosynthesis protein
VDNAGKRKEPKIAVALRYKKNQDRAPIVTASGQGRMAERIVALARENKVPVEENAPLAKALRRLIPGQEIPTELYEAVALLLAYVMEMDAKARQKR